MKKLIVITVLFFLSLESNSQNPIAEIDFENQAIERLKGAVLNDSLFLTIEGVQTAYNSKRNFYWVKSDGSVRKLPLDLNKNHSIYAVGYTEKEEYYYYLEEVKKRIFLRAIIFNKETLKSYSGDKEVEIPGTIYGIYEKDGLIYLVLAEEKTFKIHILGIKGLEADSKKEFNLTFDLGSYNTEKVKFVDAQDTFIPSKAFSPIKIIKNSDVLWITIDEPRSFNFAYTEPPPGTTYKTTVLKIDLNNAEKSIVKAFFENRTGNFSTRVFDDKLFRTYNDSDITTVEVFDVTTSKKVFSRTFTNKSDFPETFAFIHNVNNRVTKLATTRPLKIGLGIGIGYIKSDSIENYTLIMGAELEHKPYTPLVSSLGIGVFLASALTHAIVYDIGSSRFNYQYAYLNINMNGTFRVDQKADIPMNRIDEFELKQLELKGPPNLKGYLTTRNGILSIYNPKKSQSVKIYLTN